jgi:hypothetical protein
VYTSLIFFKKKLAPLDIVKDNPPSLGRVLPWILTKNQNNKPNTENKKSE